MVPKLLDALEAQWIVTQRVAGIPYLDFAGFDPALLAKTIAWFHAATLNYEQCLCHTDNQPANILYDGESYYLIDFSDSRFDYPELDLTHLLLFWAADLPAKLFIKNCHLFLDRYMIYIRIKPERWTNCLKQSIASFDARRAKHGKAGGKNSPEDVVLNRYILQAYFQ